MFDVWNEGLPEISGVSRSRSKLLEQIHFLRDRHMQSLCYIPLFKRDDAATWGDEVTKTVKAYNEKLNGITLLQGQVLPLDDDLLTDLQAGRAIPLNKTLFVLVTLDGEDLQNAAEKLYQLAVAGYYPVLLYPEKDTRIQKHPDLLYKLVKQGAYTMMDATSLLSTTDKGRKKCTRALVSGNLIHMIGNYSEIFTKWDENKMEEVDTILSKINPAQQKSIKENFANLLSSKTIRIEEPLHVDKRSISSFFSKSKA
ncbi:MULTISPECIES: CpsB/CapC family capsule biosynthesis tyrosine phosphatase [Bacillaceae]|uniref:protein-tyrosine-phosphatase n=1 Tax=Alkalicoccobacillus plakortidis TaxID=444060 RepID=A0A9D5DQI4_9BACI|nr:MULTISPECIES: CpsB/CapC family capsule biosynthesis tyrosine phosphatase [Bacillaceae]KQL58491.1 hypothetical protein AN965_04220 [Alkalicoccobacillus plakortidis]